jgi:hypothetical protein
VSNRKQSAGQTGGGHKAAADRAPQKRPYRAPRLTVYGSLRKIALGVGGDKSDGGGNPKSRA